MIWILLGIALLSGGGASSALTQHLTQVCKQAPATLKGSPQEKSAMKWLKSMKKTSQSVQSESQKLMKSAVKSGRDYQRPSSEIEPTLQPYLDRISKLDRTFLDQRDSLRATLSPEQWDSVFQNQGR